MISERSRSHRGTHFQYVQDPLRPFDPVLFDEQVLQARGWVSGMAVGGRGNTFFFEYEGQALVLRHYRRGGLIQRLVDRHYLFTGLSRTRAYREFDVLSALQRLNFPAPAPFACRVVQSGLFYQASLITRRLAGSTLAERLSLHSAPTLQASDWRSIGRTIGILHGLGFYHADLNAHNILIDDHGKVSLIDFDRARARAVPSGNPASGWCLANIDRLQRSLIKLSQAGDGEAAGFAALSQQWRHTLLAASC